MKQTVFLLRHALQLKNEQPGAGIWQPEAQLDPDGLGRIQTAANYYRARGITFHKFCHSGLVRAHETCDLFEHFTRSGRNMLGISEHPKLGPSRIKEWEAEYERWRLAQDDPAKPPLLDAPGFLKVMPDLARTQGLRTLHAVKTIAAQLEDGQNAAAISHIPLIPLAEWCATGSTEPRTHVEYCQAIEFKFENGKFVSTEAHLY